MTTILFSLGIIACGVVASALVAVICGAGINRERDE
jgi:hypothetical protein